MTRTLKVNPTKLNLFLDLLIALLFAVEMELHFTGLRNHELFGLAFTTVILLHIILHWRWVVSITRHFFAKLFHESRLNYVLNLALFVDMLVVIVTGILISRTLGFDLESLLPRSLGLEGIHRLSSNLSLVLVGVHVALHWKWIATYSKKYLLRIPHIGLHRPKPATISPASPSSNNA